MADRDPHFVLRFYDDEVHEGDVEFDECQAWLHRGADGFWRLSFSLSGAQYQDIVAMPSMRDRIDVAEKKD